MTTLAGIALLIWAVDMVKRGMTKGFGYKLNTIIEAGTKNRLVAVLSGIGVTTLVQSSNATALIVSSFAGQELIRLSMALAVMIGANIGTTLVAQFISLDLSWLMPLLIIIGVFIGFVYGKRSSRAKNLGRIFLGIGFLFLALDMITAGPDALKESAILKTIFAPLEQDLFLALILAAVLTWLLHSSLAFILLTLAFVSNGLVSLELGILMVVGANIGSGIAPVVITSKMGVSLFRVAFGNFLMRVLFGLACVVFMESLPALVAQSPLAGERAIVNFHTLFNVALAIVFFPILPLIAGLTKKLIPDIPSSDNPSDPVYLDEKLLEAPSAAMTTASREALRLSDFVQEMLEDTIKAFESEDTKIIDIIKERDNVVDDLFGHIKRYLVKLSREELDDDESARSAQIFAFAINMEHIGDIIVKNLLELAEKKAARSYNFSEEGFQEIKNMHKDVVENMKMATNIFMAPDLKAAKKLLKKKRNFREAEMRTTKSHMKRMQEGLSDTIATSSLHMDIIRDLKRINSHIAATAYPILESSGEVKPLTTKIMP